MCSIISLIIVMIVTLYLKIYTATLISFGLILVVGLVIVYINRIAPSVIPMETSDVMFVHPSQITIVSIPVESESKGETKEVKVEEINIETKH
jgi:hypothetical protein